MPKGRPKKKLVDKLTEPTVPISMTSTGTGPSEKEHLLALYKELKDLGVYSLSNLENRIARCEN